MSWSELSPAQWYYTVCAMMNSGGSFCRYLGKALLVADSCNAKSIMDAFPEFAVKYGPGSSLYVGEEDYPRIANKFPGLL